MGYSYRFIPLLSDEEFIIFDSYCEELQNLDKKSLAIATEQILDKIKTTLPDPLYWQEFIKRGLHSYVNDAQANCFINLAKLYENFSDNFSNELNKLST